MWKIQTLGAPCFPLEMLVTPKPMCIESSMTINLAWVKGTCRRDVVAPECLLVIRFIGMCCIVGALGKTCWDYEPFQPSVGKTLALGAVPGNLLLLPELKKTGLSARN